jgi:hypothetical protein
MTVRMVVTVIVVCIVILCVGSVSVEGVTDENEMTRYETQLQFNSFTKQFNKKYCFHFHYSSFAYSINLINGHGHGQSIFDNNRYETSEELLHRFQVFSDNLAYINAKNKQNLSFRVAVNQVILIHPYRYVSVMTNE